MGIDLNLICPECETNLFDAGYTYNVSPMWHKAVPGAKDMVDIDELTGQEAVPILQQAIKNLKSNPDQYKKFNPPNGWGDYDSFVEWLGIILSESLKHPTAKWSVYR